MSTTHLGPRARTVKIERDENYVISHPKTINVHKGDTLQISSTDGKFRVKFKPWPFKEKEEPKGVENPDKVLTFKKLGHFDFDCFLTPPGAKRELTYEVLDGQPNGGNGNVGTKKAS